MGNAQLFCIPNEEEPTKTNALAFSNLSESPVLVPSSSVSEQASTGPLKVEACGVDEADLSRDEIPIPVEEFLAEEEDLSVKPTSVAKRSVSFGYSTLNGASEAVITGIALLIAVSAALMERWAEDAFTMFQDNKGRKKVPTLCSESSNRT
eukprot:CAMPEP_0194297594 /NCGR_PEP_ID=MMETSP0169-20130528/59266_1 /TAXON_ID=218684 /ORGANISM="Corethron pennatum, Strain L29A3" /LENGTH=150 /DNA_ID=CAMNT_0039047443 /DNA_START=28 /DNA_END=480 /DNA_ORIENTATION=+